MDDQDTEIDAVKEEDPKAKKYEHLVKARAAAVAARKARAVESKKIKSIKQENTKLENKLMKMN